MKYLFLITINGFMLTQALAQSFAPQFIGSTGARGVSVALGSLEWTVGEAVIGTVEQAASPLYLTQGFHQPQLTVSSASEQPGAPELSVFPNPAEQVLFLHSASAVRYQLYNTEGRQVLQETAAAPQHQITVQHLPSGVYVLRVEQEDYPPRAFRVVIF